MRMEMDTYCKGKKELFERKRARVKKKLDLIRGEKGNGHVYYVKWGTSYKFKECKKGVLEKVGGGGLYRPLPPPPTPGAPPLI